MSKAGKKRSSLGQGTKLKLPAVIDGQYARATIWVVEVGAGSQSSNKGGVEVLRSINIVYSSSTRVKPFKQ